MKDGDLKSAAFNLQQTAECAYKAILLVFTNYTPYNHFLEWFDREIQEVIPDLPDFFPRDTKEAQERFENFDHACIGARYDPKYQISESDLRYFAQRVELLMSETTARCQAFLESLPKSQKTGRKRDKSLTANEQIARIHRAAGYLDPMQALARLLVLLGHKASFSVCIIPIR